MRQGSKRFTSLTALIHSLQLFTVSKYNQKDYDYFNKPPRKVGRLSQLGKANRRAKKHIGDSEMVRAAKISDARDGYFDAGR